MGFLKKIFGLEPNIKLVSATIVIDEDYKCYVSFVRHHPQLKSPEFVRLALHHYAKILFNFAPSEPMFAKTTTILRQSVDNIVSTGIEKNFSLLGTSGMSDMLKMVSSKPQNVPREIITTLFFKDTIHRAITTNIPWNIYHQHLVFSVIALLQAVVEEVPNEDIDILEKSLKNMQSAYNSGESFSEIRNLFAIPTNAYMSAITGGHRSADEK